MGDGGRLCPYCIVLVADVVFLIIHPLRTLALLLQVATDCIVEMLFTYFNPNRDMPMIVCIVPHVLSLAPLFQAAVTAGTKSCD